MDQVEILRTFIQRVQAMDTRDHNGEDNFACDFMVRAGGVRSCGDGGGHVILPGGIGPGVRMSEW